MTTYYLIPTANLPLLDPLRLIPVLGNPLADLLQPFLRPFIDFGYATGSPGRSSPSARSPLPVG